MIAKETRLEGFTLIEIMISITLTGILTSLATVEMQEIVVRNRIAAATSELQIALTYARSEAIKRSGHVVICRSKNPLAENPSCTKEPNDAKQNRGWGDGWLIFYDKDGDSVYSKTDVLLQVQDALFSNADSGSIIPAPQKNHLVFTSLGQIQASYMHFKIMRPRWDANTTHDKVLYIASGGRVRIGSR